MRYIYKLKISEILTEKFTNLVFILCFALSVILLGNANRSGCRNNRIF